MGTITNEETQTYGCGLFFVGALLSMIITAYACNFAWQESAIRVGVGKYNSTTAKFEWVVTGEKRDD